MDQVENEIAEFVDGALPSREVLKFYLKIYLGDTDWEKQLKDLQSRLVAKYDNVEEAKSFYYKQVSFAIQLPAVERSIRVDVANPQSLLFGSVKPGFSDLFGSRDWLQLLRAVAKKDLKIFEVKRDALALGYIKNIEYQPNTRQAFRWLLEKAQESGDLTDSNKERLQEIFRNLVYIYGGAVISNIFTRHESELKRIVNWRSGYFLERVLVDVYTTAEICKIKNKELETSNHRLVVRL